MCVSTRVFLLEVWGAMGTLQASGISNILKRLFEKEEGEKKEESHLNDEAPPSERGTSCRALFDRRRR